MGSEHARRGSVPTAQGVRRWRRGVMAFAAITVAHALVVALGFVAPYRAAEAVTVNVAQSFVAPFGLSFWVADEDGFFRQNGVAVELTLVRGDTQGVQALLSGGVSVLIGGPPGALTAASEGADLVEVATLAPGVYYLLVGKPSIRSPQDLRGKRVGVSGPGMAASRVAVLAALRHLGLDPRRDGIVLTPAGTQSERIAALQAGSLDATVIDSHNREVATRHGWNVFADLAALGVPMEEEGVFVTRRYLAQNEETVRRMVKAVVEANAFIRNPANRARVEAILARHLRVSSSTQAAAAYELAVGEGGFIVPKPYPFRKGLEGIIAVAGDEFPKLKQVDLNRFVADRFVRELDTSGFIDELYASRRS